MESTFVNTNFFYVDLTNFEKVKSNQLNMNRKESASQIVTFTCGILMPTLYKQLALAVGWLLNLIPTPVTFLSLM